MAKNGTVETVEVPVDVLKQMQERIAQLEATGRITHEAVMNSRAKIIDPAYEAWKEEASRPASARTQDLADKKYTDGDKFTVRLDSTKEDGKKGPSVKEHFPLTIRAHSDLEAQARYLEIMGIRKHDYKVIAEPANQAA